MDIVTARKIERWVFLIVAGAMICSRVKPSISESVEATESLFNLVRERA